MDHQEQQDYWKKVLKRFALPELEGTILNLRYKSYESSWYMKMQKENGGLGTLEEWYFWDTRDKEWKFLPQGPIDD